MILSFTVDHEMVSRNGVVRMSFVNYHYTVFILDEIRHFMSIPNSQKTRLESFMGISSCGISVFAMCNFIFSGNFLGALSATAMLSTDPSIC